MGLDLKLLPVDFYSDKLKFSHTILECDRCYELFECLDNINQLPIGDNFSCYLGYGENEDRVYGYLKETPWGEPLNYSTAREVSSAFRQKIKTLSLKNRAVLAYLEQIHEDTKVVLYWC